MSIGMADVYVLAAGGAAGLLALLVARLRNWESSLALLWGVGGLLLGLVLVVLAALSPGGHVRDAAYSAGTLEALVRRYGTDLLAVCAFWAFVSGLVVWLQPRTRRECRIAVAGMRLSLAVVVVAIVSFVLSALR